MFQQKKEIEKIEMPPEHLREIISHDTNDQATLKARLKKLNLSEDMFYGLEEHIQHIQAQAKARGFAEHIFVENFKESAFVKEVGYEIPYKYKVTVSNLKIGFSRIKDLYICMHHFYAFIDENENCSADYKSNKRKHSDGLYFEFKSNTIYGSGHSIGRVHPINVFLGYNATLSFIENNFEYIDVIARVQSTGVAVLEFKKNISKKPIGIGKNSGAHDKCIIRISDNEFDVLNIFGMANFYFEGKNIIKQLTLYAPGYLEVVPSEMSIASSINWGSHQKLDEDGEYFLPHKKIFTILKQRAIANSDTMQEIILQREIAKCDHAIAKSEKASFSYKNLNVWDNFKARENLETWGNLKVWLGVWQDITIFEFSKHISNYGTSWARPLLWLAGLNLIIVVSLYASSDQDFKMWVAFWKLFNPTNSLANMPWSNIDINGLISFLFILQKIILAFTLYEMIKIFRRFGRR